jgi:hypothetical protein
MCFVDLVLKKKSFVCECCGAADFPTIFPRWPGISTGWDAALGDGERAPSSDDSLRLWGLVSGVGVGMNDFHDVPKKAFVLAPGVGTGSRSWRGLRDGEGRGETSELMDRDISDWKGDGERGAIGGEEGTRRSELGGDLSRFLGLLAPSNPLPCLFPFSKGSARVDIASVRRPT